MARATLFIIALAVGLTGCSVDDRTLLEEGESVGGSGGSGADARAGGTGNAGADPDAGSLKECVYVAGEAPDSECETLVKNPGFHFDSSEWQSEKSAVYLGWHPVDPSDSDSSGSMGVLNLLSGISPIGVVSEGARQCLPATQGKRYGTAVDVFIPSEQVYGWDGGFEDAKAGLSILFYRKDDCQGASIPQGSSVTLAQGADSWKRSSGWTLAPQETLSMAVRLVVIKPISQPSLSALFDNVLVRER